MELTMCVVQGCPRGKQFHFSPGEYLIGSGQECSVRTKSPWVSRQHCLLIVTTQEVQVRDLGSTTGTLVNGQRISTHTIQNKDLLQMGPFVFEMAQSSSLSPSLPSEIPAENRQVMVDQPIQLPEPKLPTISQKIALEKD